MGPRGALGEGRQAALVEGLDGVADRLVAAPDLVGDLAGRRASGTRQQDLPAAESEGRGRAQAGLHLLARGVRQGTHEQWCFQSSRIPRFKLPSLLRY